jgi:hypothetical protein
MRILVLLVVVAFLAAAVPVSADYGPYGADGWPINVDGESTNPFPGSVLRPDLGPLNEVAGVTVYPYWPILTAEVMQLERDHPGLVRVHSIGTSTLGLDLWMLEIADFHRLEQGEGIPLDKREVVWVDGGTHSNEYSAVYFVTHLARFLTDEYATNETAQWIVENRHSWLMPMVNPDGSNAFGRINANLVNINRNYPVAWGALEEMPVMNDPGPYPASEIETQLNIEWFNKTRPDYYASVHCCGNLWLYPYGVEGMDPLDDPMLRRVCDEAFPTVPERCGPIWSTIYPASGSSVDTVYEYTGAVAYGYEMSGRGAVSLWGQPFTLDTVRVQEVESWEGVLHGFLNVHRYGAYPVVTVARAVGDEIEVTVKNEGYGPLVESTLHWTGVEQAEALSLPPLEPGEEAVLRLAGPFEPGILELDLSYQKRIQAAPMGARVVPMLLTLGDAGLDVAGFGDHVLVVDLSEGESRATPFGVVPVFMLLAGALALVRLTRRR